MMKVRPPLTATEYRSSYLYETGLRYARNASLLTGVDHLGSGVLPSFRMLRGGTDANEVQDVCNRRRSGGGHVRRGYGAIWLSSGLCVR